MRLFPFCLVCFADVMKQQHHGSHSEIPLRHQRRGMIKGLMSCHHDILLWSSSDFPKGPLDKPASCRESDPGLFIAKWPVWRKREPRWSCSVGKTRPCCSKG